MIKIFDNQNFIGIKFDIVTTKSTSMTEILSGEGKFSDRDYRTGDAFTSLIKYTISRN